MDVPEGEGMDEDEALIARIACGDQDALHLLYMRHRPMLRRYLWRLLGNLSLVEEAMQDTFLAVWDSAAKYRGEARVTTWMVGIAHHCAHHLIRSLSHRQLQRAAPLAEENDDLTLAPDEQQSASPEDEVLNRLALDDALAQLSAKHREVLELVFLYGFTLSEVASILGISVGTVKSRVTYARRALSKELSLVQPQEEKQP